MHASSLFLVAATLLVELCSSAAHPKEQSPVEANLPGWTHEEYLEFLTLNSTTGWEPMARVPVYTVTEGQTLDLGHGLDKRGGGNKFIAYRGGSCAGTTSFTAENFGCGVCVTTGQSTSNRIFGAGYLWRQTIGGKYPTASWFSGPNCDGWQVHSQGIRSKEYDSCDTASAYGVNPLPQSVILYQGC